MNCVETLQTFEETFLKAKVQMVQIPKYSYSFMVPIGNWFFFSSTSCREEHNMFNDRMDELYICFVHNSYLIPRTNIMKYHSD